MSANSNENSRLGHDPLAWLDDDEAPASNSVATSEVQAKSAQAASAEPHTEDADLHPSAEVVGRVAVDNGLATLFLPERLVVQSVTALHREWQQLTQQIKFESMCINAMQVEDIDAAGIQFLYAASQHFRGKGYHVTLYGVPDHIARAFGVCGLAEYFEAIADAA